MFQQTCTLARRAVVVCILSVLSIGRVEAQRAEVPATLETRIEALTRDLIAASALSGDAKKKLVELRAAISALEEKTPDDDAANFAVRAKDILGIAARLTLGRTPTLADSQNAATLIAAVQKLELADPTKAAIRRAKDLSETIDKPEKVIQTFPELRAAFLTLTGQLEAVEEVDFLATVTRRAQSLEALLTKVGTSTPPTSLAAIAAIAALDTKVAAYRKQANPLVDIVHAEYGDLRSRPSARGARGQLCNATDSLREACQARADCVLPNPASLCAKDPGEFIPAAHKGVRVQFRCVDTQLKVYAAPAVTGMVTEASHSNWLLLRAAGQKFSCVSAKPS